MFDTADAADPAGRPIPDCEMASPVQNGSAGSAAKDGSLNDDFYWSGDEEDFVASPDRVSRLAGSRNLADYAVVNMVADVLDTREWSIPGINSANHWVAWQLGLNTRHASRILKISERRDELGIAFKYFAEGALSIDQMSLISTYCPVGHDQTVAALAVNATIPQLRRILRDYQYDDNQYDDDHDAGEDNEADGLDGSSLNGARHDGDNSDGLEPDGLAQANGRTPEDLNVGEESRPSSDTGEAENGSGSSDGVGGEDYNSCPDVDLPPGISSGEMNKPYRGFGYGFDEEGHFRMWLRCGPDDGAEIEAALNQARAWLKADTGEIDVSGFESFLTLIRSGVEADPSGSRASDNKVLVHLEENELQAWANGLRPHLHLGPLLPQQAFELLSCDANLQVVVSRFGRAIALGRTQKLIPHWLRQIVINRDHGCRAPGCSAQRWLDVHHMKHWSKGGKTDPDNLVTLCRKHHREHHRGTFHIKGCPDAPVHQNQLKFFTSANQEIVQPKPIPDPPPEGWYVQGSGERYDSSLIDIPPNKLTDDEFDVGEALDSESNGEHRFPNQQDPDTSHPETTTPRCVNGKGQQPRARGPAPGIPDPKKPNL